MKGDAIFRAAKQVRAHRTRTVHRLARARTMPEHGRVYVTGCGVTYNALVEASLSTRPVTCKLCLKQEGVPC